MPLLLLVLIAAPRCQVWAEQYAFLVGVGKYKSKELKELRYAEVDIKSLYYALRRVGYPQNNIVVLSPQAGAVDPRFVPERKDIAETRLRLAASENRNEIVITGTTALRLWPESGACLGIAGWSNCDRCY